MSLNGMQIAQMAREFQASYKPQPKPTSQGRIKIIAGSQRIGQMVNGHAITGFGKIWSEVIRDEDTSAWGFQPGQDHRVNMQYAYFN